jgi:hypothetical protein
LVKGRLYIRGDFWNLPKQLNRSLCTTPSLFTGKIDGAASTTHLDHLLNILVGSLVPGLPHHLDQ